MAPILQSCSTVIERFEKIELEKNIIQLIFGSVVQNHVLSHQEKIPGRAITGKAFLSPKFSMTGIVAPFCF